MTKIMVIDGMVQCPECGDQLMGKYAVDLVAYLRWNEKEKCWEMGLISHEEKDFLFTIFCQDCGFSIDENAIPGVEVETWNDKWARSEDFARWEGSDE